MRPSLAQFSGPGASIRRVSLVDFTVTMSGFRFRYTQWPYDAYTLTAEITNALPSWRMFA
jgi:hypothetical protein